MIICLLLLFLYAKHTHKNESKESWRGKMQLGFIWILELLFPQSRQHSLCYCRYLNFFLEPTLESTSSFSVAVLAPCMA